MNIPAKYRREGYPNEWWLTDYTMEQVERHIAYLERKLAGYQKDAEYLRKWREIKGRNPGMHCCCEFDEDGEKQIEWCSVHAEMRDRIVKLEKAIYAGRCEKTGNLFGSDTWVEGYTCPCHYCSHAIDALMKDDGTVTPIWMLLGEGDE